MTDLFGDNRMSVAMLDVESGAMATYGHDAIDTASIVKVDILFWITAADWARSSVLNLRPWSCAWSSRVASRHRW
ncbi:hypothetical protein AB0A81_38430 [Streptomyces flaveolus]|uniref:Uncharacterized protein n=1 Tax=Streptomyces flaveolus TaxID=67297 RepID=A0ABV1VLT8_9ACTN